MNSVLNKNLFLFLSLFLALILIIYIANILIPFFIGIFLAYLLDPIVDYLEKKKINRGLASAVSLIIFFIVISIITFFILPILLFQIKNFLIEFPEIINIINQKINLIIERAQENISFINSSSTIKDFLPNISKLLTSFIKSLVSSSLAIFNIITIILITPIVSWYFLKDWDIILKSLINLFSSKYQILISSYARELNIIFGSYLRGQILVSFSLSIFYFICFYILDLNYSLFIGIFSGFFSFIPLVGIIISFLITCSLTYLQFTEVNILFYVALIFLIGQILESNFLTPKLIGKKLGLHPLLVLFSIFVFGYVLGIVGIIFATPLMASIILVFKKLLKHNE